MYKNNLKRSTLVLLLSTMLVCFLLFSNMFSIQELGHDCHPEQCSICHMLHDIESSAKQLLGGLAFFDGLLPITILSLVLLLVTPLLAHLTPITQKVKMLN